MLSSVFDGLQEAVIVVRLDSKEIVYINAAARKVFQIQDNQVLAGYCYDYLGCNGDRCKNCNCFTDEFFGRYKNEPLYFRGRYYSIKGHKIIEDKVGYYASIALDITNEIRADRIARENTQILNKALEESDLIYWEYDIQTHTCYRTERFVSALGGPYVVPLIPEEIEKYNVFAYEDIPKVRSMYERILAGEDEVEDYVRVNFIRGEILVRMHLSTIFDENDDRIKVVGIMDNQEEQRELEYSLFVAAEQNQFHIYAYDFVTGEMQYFKHNNKIESTLELVVEDFYDAYKGSIRYQEQYLLDEVLEKSRNGEKDLEIVVHRKDRRYQNYRTVRLNFFNTYDAAGNAKKVYISESDITENEKQKKQYESQLVYMDSYKKDSLAYADINVSKNRVLNIKTRYSRLRKGVDTHTVENWAELMSRHFGNKELVADFLKTFSRVNFRAQYENGVSKIEYSAPFWLNEESTIWANFEASLLKNPVSGELEGFLMVKDVTSQKLKVEIGRTISDLNFEVLCTIDVRTTLVEEIFSGDKKIDRPMISGEYDKLMSSQVNFIDESQVDEVAGKVNLQRVIDELMRADRYNVTVSGVNKNGVRVFKRVSYVNLKDFPQMILMGMQDVSDIYREERKKNEMLEKALEEAKDAENAKIDFLSRMSHDLRTPLNGILGMAEIAYDECYDENIREYIRKMSSSGENLLALVNDILDIAQAEEKKLSLRREPYAFNEFLDNINNIIKEQCENKGIRYTQNLEDLEGKWLFVDKLRLGQIFINLLSNAVKYTPEGGNVGFSGKILKETGTDIYAEFHVVDDGIGMSEGFLAHAFDAFSQANTSTVDNRMGSGLGLAIVKQILDLTNGEIEIDSKLGEGTDIKILLHLKTTVPIASKDEDNTSEQNVNLSGLRILVVEDQPLNAKILTKLLNKHDVVVDVAENGKRAVAAYLESKEYQYDGILMDVRMPVMDGLEATRIIRSHKERRDCNLPIIATTANAFVEDKEMCVEAGMNDHISKPINSKKLYRCLELNILGKE